MKIDRIIAIIMILMEKETIKASELSNILEVSVRTIYRDIETILKAGIPIVSSTGPGGGIGIMDTYKIEKRLFSKSDIFDLLLGLNQIQNIFPNKNFKNTLAKIEGIISSEDYEEIKLKINQIKIDIQPWHGKSIIQKKFETIKNSLNTQKVIRFKYKTRQRTETFREVEPYRLLLKENNWYVQGYCRMRESYRTFKLTRMDEIEILDEEYNLDSLSFEKLKNNTFDNDSREKIKLQIDKSFLEEIVNLFNKNSIVEDYGQYYLLYTYLPIKEETAHLLITHSDHCLCLEPKSMISLIKKILKKTMNLYSMLY